MEETIEDIEKTKEDELINEGFRNRINDETADAYKILSILYGLVIFVGGVAFSISHAIVPTEAAEIIKYSAEIYFTYLYWVSISWITFCIIDILHHRRKVKIPTSTLSRLVSNLINANNDGSLAQTKVISIPSESARHSFPTPYTNLESLVENEEDELNENDNEELEIIPDEQTTNDDQTITFKEYHVKSNSVDDVSHRSLTFKTRDTGRDVFDRRSALSPKQQYNLRTYVRHRKDSIVQHVIGYNYDDNSSVGGLYTRVGIGIFCLGTAIHSSLSILSNLENLSCTRWTAVMDDFSRLLFSFIQFFFIFKHSNLIIRAHESIARLAVIHIVVTNLCVWFRMVVIETKSQIIELQSHEIAAAHHNKAIGHSGSDSDDTINLLRRLLILPSECSNLHAKGVLVTTFIHEGYMKLQPLLYPCTIEFSLMCLTLFFLIWENIGKTFTHNISDKASTKNVFMVNCHASIKGLFVGMIFFSFTMISIILYAVFRHKIGDNHHMTSSAMVKIDHNYSHPFTNTATVPYRQHSIAAKGSVHGPLATTAKIKPTIQYDIVILEIVNLCLLTLSLCATMFALMKIRKVGSRRTTTRFDDVLIIISLIGIYLYSFFSAFAIISNLNSAPWVVYIKVAIIILEFVEGTVHAMFILVALRKRLRRTSKYAYPARQMITLLIMLDLSLWLEKTTTTTKHEANPFQLAFYHVLPWSIIAAIATPLQIFFRFHASVCLSHVWAHMYQFPPYEPVVSHD